MNKQYYRNRNRNRNRNRKRRNFLDFSLKISFPFLCGQQNILYRGNFFYSGSTVEHLHKLSKIQLLTKSYVQSETVGYQCVCMPSI